MTKHTHTLALLSAALLQACSTDAIAPGPRPVSVHVTAIRSNELNALSLTATYEAHGSDSVIVTATDTYGATVALNRGSDGTAILLGLQPRSRYKIKVQAWRGGVAANSEPAEAFTGELPVELESAHMELLRGKRHGRGYILVPMMTAKHANLVAFDTAGRLAWDRQFEPIPIVEAKQQANGNFTVFQGTTRGWDKTQGRFIEISPEGNLVRTWQAPEGFYTDSHEIILAQEDGEAVAYLFGYNMRDASTLAGYSAGSEIAGHQVFRVTASGQWKVVHDAWKEFSLDEAYEPPQPSGDFDHPNSLSFDADSNLVISYRVLGTVAKIDRHNGRVMWRLGGLKSDFTFTNDPEDGFSAQHNAQIIAKDHLLVFDNGWRHSPQYTRALEYEIDERSHQARLVWSYTHDDKTFTPYTGSIQRTRDGHTFVGFSNINVIADVTKEGNLSGEFRPMISKDASSGFYRAVVIDNLYTYAKP